MVEEREKKLSRQEEQKEHRLRQSYRTYRIIGGMLLVAAFVGERWREIYRFALDHDFRFLSYGDSNLLEKPVTK